MNQNEASWDKLLRIRTSGRDDSGADQFRYPYEPTPYSVIDRLANSGEIRKSSVLLDYGCGKGRVDFYLSYQIGCRSLGIECNERIYKEALNNQESGISARKVKFELQSAEKYIVPPEVDQCFFFNPFSVQILRKVISRILDSFYESPRKISLYFYYPSDEYTAYLMSVKELAFYNEIDCSDLFPGENPRERIMIFHLDSE